jgi:hypothetical protein
VTISSVQVGDVCRQQHGSDYRTQISKLLTQGESNMDPEISKWLLTVIGSAFLLAAPLAVPAIREAIGKYIAAFVQHHFDERIEKLRSELRRSEEKFAAELRTNEQQLRSLTDAALSLRSSRQAALDARRLQAVEKLWAAKIASDRMRLAANLVSHLNMDEMFKAAENGDPKIQNFANTLDSLTGLDLKEEAPQMSATSERPFLSPNVWALFSAYQGVMLHSVMPLKALATGTTKYFKKEDTVKPLLLLALPEFADYIEKYGFSGYYHLLNVLEERLLKAIQEMLEGRDVDDAALNDPRRSCRQPDTSRSTPFRSRCGAPKFPSLQKSSARKLSEDRAYHATAASTQSA